MKHRKQLTALLALIFSITLVFQSFAVYWRPYVYSSYAAIEAEVGKLYTCGYGDWRQYYSKSTNGYDWSHEYTTLDGSDIRLFYPPSYFYAYVGTNQYNYTARYKMIGGLRPFNVTYYNSTHSGGHNGSTTVTCNATMYIGHGQYYWSGWRYGDLSTWVNNTSVGKRDVIPISAGAQIRYLDYVDSGGDVGYQGVITLAVAHTPGGWVSNDVAGRKPTDETKSLK